MSEQPTLSRTASNINFYINQNEQGLAATIPQNQPYIDLLGMLQQLDEIKKETDAMIAKKLEMCKRLGISVDI